MASGIAHDLNQSLALISGYSDMARQELLLAAPQLERVREMVAITARAALEGGWDLRGTKPAICRLFPLSYEADAIVIADEYPEYSCAHVDGPTLYRITRDALADVFGEPLVAALDAAEAQVLAAAAPPRRLPVAR